MTSIHFLIALLLTLTTYNITCVAFRTPVIRFPRPTTIEYNSQTARAPFFIVNRLINVAIVFDSFVLWDVAVADAAGDDSDACVVAEC